MDKSVFMGQFDVAGPPDILKATLGSCVGIVLIDQVKSLYGLAHVMLPKNHDANKSQEGKFADTAIPALIKSMGLNQKNASRLIAVLAGGANMFPSNTSLTRIGDKNIEAVCDILASFSIPVVAKKLGGERGCQLEVDTVAEKIMLNAIGGTPQILWQKTVHTF